ncbi:hypothetical protein [Streptomyces albidus (ex Kaewkla and Franco 2022)]|uniref:hypothetical protein n=1 Tax=Streptomyces albidus (ex Kaewkla and Franco 2022) TaxID=722709 RepID=UPI0015EE7587|nr:hypothetical protein [Streptomyces albidus (ex Kaewkla and Franco 2022)]
MSETQAGTTDTRNDQAGQGSGRHRGQAAGQEESGQRTQGRHRRPPQEAER